MLAKLTVVTAFVVLAWAAWPSRRVRERGRQTALATLVLALFGAIGLGLVQLVRPDLATWMEHPAIEDWWERQLSDASAMPPGIWWLLGFAAVLVIVIQRLYAVSTSTSTSVSVDQMTPVGVSSRFGRSRSSDSGNGRTELQRALDAMKQAQTESASSRSERRVEDLLPPR